jgi:hypothetical protein
LAIGIEEVRAAGRAEIHRGDMVKSKPCCQELILGNGNQVKMNRRLCDGVVARRLHIQEGERRPFGM